MARPIRFVHAADLHLGAPFLGIDAADDRVRAALVAATFDALAAVVDTCLAREGDFLVIAGDVFDEAHPSLAALASFRREMARLDAAGIPVFVAAGNHDHLRRGVAPAGLPENVRYFSAGAVERFVLELDAGTRCVLYGRSYGQREQAENLAAGFARGAEDGDAPAVGVLHTNVGGRPDDGTYAPCAAADLAAARMDYWALGHIHLAEQVSDTPRARYSGCTQGLNPKETGPHGCLVVTLDSRHADEESVETCAVRWAALEVDITGAADEDEVLASIGAACATVRSEAGGRPVVARVTLLGRADAHGVLLRPGTLPGLLEAARDEQMAPADDWVWIDRIRDESRLPVEAGTYRGTPTFIGELVRVADEILADPNRAAAFVAAQTDAAVARFRPGGFAPQAPDIVARALDLCLDGLAEEE